MKREEKKKGDMNMFFMIGDKKCPNCGVEGKLWKKAPEVFVCPMCSSIFNKFGLIVDGEKQEVVLA
jgi:ribosomal protein S27E